MVTRFRYLTIFFILVLLINTASAGFEVGDISHFIDEIYSPSEDIKGWVNISFMGEPTNSVFEDPEGNSIDSIDLLNVNSDYDYSCDPSNCQTDYSASNGETTKTLTLDAGNSEIFGLKFTGDIGSISDISFNVSGSASVSCNNQLKVDFLADGSSEASNDKVHVDICSPSKNNGCFDNTASTTLYEIDVVGNTPFCQRIKLAEAPGFKIGAWVNNISGVSDALVMALYDDSGNFIDDCELPETVSGGSEVSCDVDYLVTEKEDYYICIYSPGAGSGTYKIEGYPDYSNGCGFYGNPVPPTTPAAYNIFVWEKKFDSVGTINVINNIPGDTLGNLAFDYIVSRYGSSDCSSNDCIVPIEFISGEDGQSITIENIVAKYLQSGIGPAEENSLYDLNETPATIDSEFQKLYLDGGNFSVPNSLGDYAFFLTLGGENVTNKIVSVKDIPEILSVSPTKTGSAFPTPFKVSVRSSSNITKYNWDFGDNTRTTTSTNKTIHTYDSVGLYDLKINVTDENDLSSFRIFKINVSLPKDAINSTLKKMREDINNIKDQIKDEDLFSQKSLNSALRIEDTEKILENLEANFSLATLEAEYNQILSELLSLNEVPELITKSRVADSVTFFSEKENVNVDIVQAIGGGSFESSREGDYIDAILDWNFENLETKVTFKEFSARYDLFTGPILKVFELRIKEIGEVGLDSNLIIRELDNLKFDKNYSEEEESGYVYINLENLPITITFSTTEDVDFINLPAFVSPSLNRLSISEDVIEDEEEDGSKRNIFILIIFLLALIGFVTYMVLQQWYKKKYEDYLFKNKTDLYNMVTYVNNAKKRGLKRGEIASNLKKAGWGSERVRYVMRKYAGRRTGMLEIPVTNVLYKLKKRENSKKR